MLVLTSDCCLCLGCGLLLGPLGTGEGWDTRSRTGWSLLWTLDTSVNNKQSHHKKHWCISLTGLNNDAFFFSITWHTWELHGSRVSKDLTFADAFVKVLLFLFFFFPHLIVKVMSHSCCSSTKRHKLQAFNEPLEQFRWKVAFLASPHVEFASTQHNATYLTYLNSHYLDLTQISHQPFNVMLESANICSCSIRLILYNNSFTSFTSLTDR